ncbi:DJ-1/PfpI family protein [Paenibacillus sp. H1-7]|uniref:DJ-1/PfpI family protein n=1 Tax=Paenibacillus sp. H1-7 TaxID=2282849 RepID=UPI001EF90685|nr:DJ-1/PfpI family protein [Paenibacillus sp. H1-7]ULL16326.1 DJ-1/PfpI family protein [Paenibacillus sp. H1-7]
MHIQIVLFDGFDLLDALAPYEVFRAAEMFSDGAWSVELVTAEGARFVASGMNGPQVEANGKLTPDRPGIILVPGASGPMTGEGHDSVPVLLRKAMETELTGIIGKAMQKPDMSVATVCGGSLILAMGGLLEGRRAVTNHLGMDVLEATGAIPIRARVVVDGNLVTGGGVTSGLDVALYLVERELGPQIAHEVEQLFEYERRGTVWQSRGLTPMGSLSSDREQQSKTNSHNLKEAPPGSDHRKSTSCFEGIWKASIATPVGKMEVTFHISSESGQLCGAAIQGDETAVFMNPVIEGNRLTWSQQVTKPMRLNLKFDVTVNGDTMTGMAKAGVLPSSKVTAERISDSV